MRQTSVKLTVLVLLLTLITLTRALAQAPAPAGEWVKDEDNPVLEPGSALGWDGGAVFAPSVLTSEGTFQMWYTGQVATSTAVVPPVIGRATSSDGSNWIKDSGNPVLAGGLPGEWDAGGAEDAVVIEVDGTYHLWYASRSEGSGSRIGYATSPDGVNWTRHEANPVLEPGPEGSWDVRGVRPGAVLWINGEYRMWYTGANAAGTAQIGYATSPDGVEWTKHAGTPVLQAGGADWEAPGVYRPAVVFDGTTYRMWYTGAGSDGIHRVGFATSSDGVHWTRDPGNPMLVPGEPGAWDASSVTQPAVVFDRESATYHLWYTGQAAGVRRIGHATAKAGYRVYLPLIRR